MIQLIVNGESRDIDVDPGVPLVAVLRDTLGLSETRFGCGEGRCGACMVMVGGQAVRSCQIPVRAVKGQPVTTLEGFRTAGIPHPLEALIREAQDFQCGHCGSGIIVDVCRRHGTWLDPDELEQIAGFVLARGPDADFVNVRDAAAAPDPVRDPAASAFARILAEHRVHERGPSVSPLQLFDFLFGRLR